jgi:hypothetical protein
MNIDYKHTFKLCMKCYLQVNNYKLGDGAKLWDYIYKFKVVGDCT